ncbi:MAG TPA: AAA family ATPase, partial [Candidatus Acidoferrum sp.]|nr:AAA family ATPase [Candidatus Acidoferrum sp.]
MSGVIIAVTNQKGGVGKTTTAVNLAYSLTKSGKKVLLVDFDPQGNATSGLGVDKQSLKRTVIEAIQDNMPTVDSVLETKYKHLHLLPTTPQLANTEAELLANGEHRFTRLKSALYGHNYDYVIIDCPPSLSLLTVNALVAAQYLLMPVQAEFYALEGLGQLLETKQLIGKS